MRIYPIGSKIRLHYDGKEYTIVGRWGNRFYRLRTSNSDGFNDASIIQFTTVDELSNRNCYLLKYTFIHGAGIDICECVEACKSSQSESRVFYDNQGRDLWRYDKTSDTFINENGEKIESLYSISQILKMKFIERRVKTDLEKEIEELENQIESLSRKCKIED